MKYIIPLLALIFLSACATPAQHNTPSKKVEVTIHGVQKTAVKDRLTSDMVNRGYLMTKSDDSLIAFDRAVDNFMVNALLSSRYDSTTNARVTYNLIQLDKDVRVIADCAVITNPGSAFEKRTDMNGNPDTYKIQAMLDSLKNMIEK